MQHRMPVDVHQQGSALAVEAGISLASMRSAISLRARITMVLLVVRPGGYGRQGWVGSVTMLIGLADGRTITQTINGGKDAGLSSTCTPVQVDDNPVRPGHLAPSCWTSGAPMSLSSLGLTALDEAVYRALLRGDGAPAGDPGATRESLARLVHLELVRMDADGRAVAIEPGHAISRLIRRRLLETSAEQRRISTAWETLHLLTAEGHSGDASLGVRRIDGVEQVNEQLRSMAADACEAMTIHSVRREVVPQRLPSFLKRLAEGVRWRTIVPRENLSRPNVIEYSLALHRAGDRHRVIDEPAQQMVILDRAVAFVPTVPNASGSGALMIRQPGAVATMVDLFERVWAHATDLEPDQAPALTPRERQVLHLLSSAGKDEVAAREMGVSLRTYRRHVAELLDRLGAANRFQAALFAKQQGWI